MPVTLQAVMARVRSGENHTRGAIRAVLDLQTNAEMLVGDSIHDNGAGFRARYRNRDDAGTAKRLVLTRNWSDEQRRNALALCYTYRRQLVAIANGCQTRNQVGRFKLRAIHDAESRTYRNAQRAAHTEAPRWQPGRAVVGRPGGASPRVAAPSRLEDKVAALTRQVEQLALAIAA